MITMGEIVLIHDLKRQGLSVSAIARKLGMDRKTVRKHLEVGIAPPAYSPRAAQPRLIEPFEDYLLARITAWPELSGKRLLRELKERGYPGCYSVVTDFLRGVRPPRVQPFERRFETAPGKQAQVDFAQFQAEFSDEPGIVRILWLFTIILGHSRWLWGKFCATQDLQTVLRCHIDAFAAMDGAPSELLYDPMKTAVIGEYANGVVQYNTSLVSLLNHYGAVPRACRPYRAKSSPWCRHQSEAHGGRARSSDPITMSGRISSGPEAFATSTISTPSSTAGARRSPSRGCMSPPAALSTTIFSRRYRR